MASWIKNVKDSSKRLKNGIARSIGAGGDEEDCSDPVLAYRSHRFDQYDESLDKVEKAMSHFLETAQAHAHASDELMHAFSVFFEGQMQDVTPDDEDYAATKSLAQTALRLEEIHQSLRANVVEAARDMQASQVLRSIHHIRHSNAGLHKQLHGLKQKLADYETLHRAVETQRKTGATPAEIDRLQQKTNAAEAVLVAMTNGINTELNAIEARRGTDLKNELLSVVACQLFVHMRAHTHYEQLLPLVPGLARPLLQVAEYAARARPHEHPCEHAVMGVVPYAGAASRGVIDAPLAFHQPLVNVDTAAVHPLPIAPFQRLHCVEMLAVAAYGRSGSGETPPMRRQ